MFLITAPGIAGAHSKYQCTGPDGFQNVTAIKAHRMIEKGDVFILDVRLPVEYNYGHIEGAKLIPLRDAPKIDPGTLPKDKLLEARLKELPHNKYKKIIVYCMQGHRSIDACKILVKAGYKNVYNLHDDKKQTGGIIAWVNEGYPIVIDPANWASGYPHNP
jgi:rhodanese-related sulfurtransferase